MRTFVMLLVAMVVGVRASGQIIVGRGGSGLLTFDSAPTADEWTTRSYGGDNGGVGIVTAAQLDAQVQLVSVTDGMNTLGTSTIVPPTQNNFARWNSAGQFLQSRIGNVEFTVLLAKLVNETGSVVGAIGIDYDLAGGGIFGQENIFGFRGYLSLTGEPGSWVLIPDVCVTSVGHVSAVAWLIDSGGWHPDSALYVLWADDNGPNSDPYYTIDNLEFTIAPRLMIEQVVGGVQLSWRGDWPAFGVAARSTVDAAVGEIFHPSHEATLVDGNYTMFVPFISGERYFRLRAATGVE